MYGIYANIGGILMVNVTIYSIHGSYGYWGPFWDITSHQLRRGLPGLAWSTLQKLLGPCWHEFTVVKHCSCGGCGSKLLNL
jgi:hypothetical protein